MRSKLLELFEIAYRVAVVIRSLSYHDTFSPLPQRYKIEYDGILGWLQEFLAAEEGKR